jgi:hypothetical protein
MAPRRFRTPVAWLLGRQMIASAKQIALYAGYGDKLDPKDWMQGTRLSFAPAEDGELWFDYLSDTGDGSAATYGIAYLCLRDLWATSTPSSGGGLGFDAPPQGTRLPRGSFLVIGGDTAYHVADEATLRERFLQPFQWAYEDVTTDTGAEPRVTPILGIPGNHDYYDALDGFNRVFRKPVGPDAAGHFKVAGYERVQEGTYFVVDLPFSWRLLGLDAQSGKLDFRQKEFFRELLGGDAESRTRTPVIVVTPEPSTVFGQTIGADSPLAASLKDIGLSRPFLGEELAEPVRLDLAGDVHHYARYWGPAPGEPAHYASVVSGLGGAFLHPSDTLIGPIAPRAIFPTPAASRKATTIQLLNPLRIARGGYVWLIGVVMALVIYFATGVPDSTRLFEAPSGGLLRWLRDNVFALPEGAPSPFPDSAIVFLSLALALGLLGLTGWLRGRIHARRLSRSLGYPAIALCWVALLATPYFALWGFGRHSAATLVSDLVLLAVLALGLLGLTWAGWAVAGSRHSSKGKAGFALLGLTHGVAQLATPLLFASRPSLLAGAVGLAIAVGATLAAYPLATRNAKLPLTALFVAHAVVQIAVPLLLAEAQPASLAGFALAGVIGAITSCMWFGAYLTVALAFDGHNNEAGGASRLESYKQFMRIRLHLKNGAPALTAYAIGFEQAEQDGKALRPRLIDVFELS